MFNKISRPKQIYKEVALQIEEAIISKKLNIGDRLPSEREMAETFDVSRRTLRESLRVVEQKGLIEIRPSGAFVVMETNEKFSQSLALALRTQKLSWRDIAQFRGDLEENIVLRALEKAGDKDIYKLNDFIRRMESILAMGELLDWKSYLNLDRKFHLYLAKMAGNPIYDLILRTFLDNLGKYYQAYQPRRVAFGHDNLENIKMIVKAIVNKDRTSARQEIRNHFELGTTYIEGGNEVSPEV